MKSPNLTDEEYISPIENTKFLKKITKNDYITYIYRAKNEIAKTKSIDNLIANPENFEKRLHDWAEKQESRLNPSKSIGTHIKVKIIASIIAIFKYNQNIQENYYRLYTLWHDVLKRTSKKISDHYNSNMPSARQSEGYIDFKELCKKRDELKEGSQERLLLCMYSMIPPTRADYYDCYLYSKQPHVDQGNYIVLRENEPILVLNTYKTHRKYGKIIIRLPDELVNEITISLEKLPRNYLFVRPFNHQPFTECKDAMHAYNKWANSVLKRLFNRKYASISNIRHAYISRHDLDLANKTLAERDEIAHKMQHSVDMQSRYYFMNVD